MDRKEERTLDKPADAFPPQGVTEYIAAGLLVPSKASPDQVRLEMK